MANQPRTPLAGDVQATPKDLGPAENLSPEEQQAIRSSDKRDVSPRGPGPDTSGTRVRYIPYGGGTHAEVRSSDFQREGLNHQTVNFNFRNNVFTAEVGNGEQGTLSQEAADMLTSKYPTMFEYLDEGE